MHKKDNSPPLVVHRPPNPNDPPKFDIIGDDIVPANIKAYDLVSKNPV